MRGAERLPARDPKRGNETFERIDDHHKEAGFPTEYAKDICTARVAAAFIANIEIRAAQNFANNDRSRKRAEEIADDDDGEEG